MSKGRSPFRYTPEQRKALFAALPHAAEDPLDFSMTRGEFALSFLQSAASSYLGLLEDVERMPDRELLRKKREKVLNELQSVRAIIEDSPYLRALNWVLEDQSETIRTSGCTKESFAEKLIMRMNDETLEDYMAIRAIDRLVREYERESWEEILKPKHSKDLKHRNNFIFNAAQTWADLNDKMLEECEISALGPMMRYMQAALDPVLSIAGESIGPESIKLLVTRMKRDRLVMKPAE